MFVRIDTVTRTALQLSYRDLTKACLAAKCCHLSSKQEAQCNICGPTKPVISLVSECETPSMLDKNVEQYTFTLKSSCSSSRYHDCQFLLTLPRDHLHSQVFLQIDLGKGTEPLVSEPFSLQARLKKHGYIVGPV